MSSDASGTDGTATASPRACRHCGDPIDASHDYYWPGSVNHVTCASKALVDGVCPFEGNGSMCGKHADVQYGPMPSADDALPAAPGKAPGRAREYGPAEGRPSPSPDDLSNAVMVLLMADEQDMLTDEHRARIARIVQDASARTSAVGSPGR